MPVSRVDQFLIAAAAVLVVALGGIGWAIISGATAPRDETPAGGMPIGLAEASALPAASSALAPAGAPIVVDVEGAVLRPGLYHLVPGARVGDAIAAAGGYSSSVDLDAAAMELNLAELLADGDKIVVPRLRPPDAPDAAAEDDGSTAGGLVNVNTADAAALEALPGIGPVTVEKILAAREEQPFGSLEEMVERDVINNGQLEKIRDLATAG